MFSRVRKMWACVVFTCPENVGVCCFHVPRKCGGVLFSHTQKMWRWVAWTYPENVGMWCFYVPRKCGDVFFLSAAVVKYGQHFGP